MTAVLHRFGPRLLHRLLTPAERDQRHWDGPALARRWALKEAVAKAVGTGIGGQLSFQDILITATPNRAPQCTVRGVPGRVLVSVTDDGGAALAFAVWERA